MISLPTFINILSSFASQGLVFSNEQDFQFAFARALDQLPSVSQVKLEALSIDEDWTEIEKKIQSGKPVSAKKKEYTDILVQTTDGMYCAIELKFKTPDKVCIYDTPSQGKVITMAQGAYDINSYEVVKDVQRLENINNRFFPGGITIDKGFVVLLTNYAKLRYYDMSRVPAWKGYALNEARQYLPAGPIFFRGTDTEYGGKTKYKAITLIREHALNWYDYPLRSYTDYEDKAKSHSPGFSFLIIES